ncbi:MAG: putative imidazole glycerol phosphate synthase subunit hisF2 [Candidatus Woesearchaeota archaeon]|nr:MAG: putative imidazole glycerol phosphate synthase subunit hisF2 [Candidatus Woesearchaeota archaeon]
MIQLPRVIPVLLLKNAGLVKTKKFKEAKYVGDPINAVKIFNEKEVDELIFLDITASKEKKKPNLKLLDEIATECFMPLCYGGGIKTIEDIKSIINAGVEKVALNSIAIENPLFVKQASDIFGSSTIVVSIDIKKKFWGKKSIYTYSGTQSTGMDPLKFAHQMQKNGAGELLVNSIDNDGMMQGYDYELIKQISKEVDIPVIACGGAGNLSHLKEAYNAGASALAAGSMFVFHGQHRAVLINYPSQKELQEIFKK